MALFLKAVHDGVMVGVDPVVMVDGCFIVRLESTFHEGSKVPLWGWEVEEVAAVVPDLGGVNRVSPQVEPCHIMDGQFTRPVDSSAHRGGVGVIDPSQLALEDWCEDLRLKACWSLACPFELSEFPCECVENLVCIRSLTAGLM